MIIYSVILLFTIVGIAGVGFWIIFSRTPYDRPDSEDDKHQSDD